MRPHPSYMKVILLSGLCVTVVRLLFAHAIEASPSFVRAFGSGTLMSWSIVTLLIGVLSAVVLIAGWIVVDKMRAGAAVIRD